MTNEDEVETREFSVEFDSGDGAGFMPRTFLLIEKNGKTYMIDIGHADWAVDWVREHG